MLRASLRPPVRTLVWLRIRIPIYIAMSARMCRSQLEEGGDSDPKHVTAPELDTFNSLVEGISPGFDPDRVLLRRVFFVDQNKTKYILVGFFPARNYQPLVEFEAHESTSPILTNHHVRTMAEHLPRQCDALCNDEYYISKYGDFGMNTAGGYRVARVHLGKKWILIKIHELRYLSYIFFMVYNQLIRYPEDLPDVMN